jgi:ABC-2 type transport system permease protein
MSDILQSPARSCGPSSAPRWPTSSSAPSWRVTLFVFFWVETFFARNIADARPLFEWMPVLLIFLVAALTMRLWSEERRAGTLELLLTPGVDLASWCHGQVPGGLGWWRWPWP